MRQHLTVYHIKKEFADKCEDSFESLLRKTNEVQDLGFAKDTPFKAQLFISKSKEESELKPPPWVEFLKPGFGEFSVPTTQSIGAVLFVGILYEEKEGKKKKEIEEVFAFTFGNGRYFLNPKSYEGDYGLRVALNVLYDYAGGTIEPNRLRSVAAKTVAANTIRTKKQTDREASFEAFGVDIQRDTLTAVTGTPPVKSGFWSSLLSGSESLATTPGVDLEGLGNYCQGIAETYQKGIYKDDFDWIDNRRAVIEPGRIEELNGGLIQTLKDTPEKITLTVPEMIEFSDIDHFYFSFNEDKEFQDPGDIDLMEALKLKKGEDLLAKLNNEKLIVIYAPGNKEDSWPLFDCLSGEIKLGGKTYILSEGEFFEVNNDFLKEINDFIGGLHEKKGLLPDCPKNMTEGAYNEATAKKIKSLLLLDKKTVRLRRRTTPIEICDLLTKDGCFIHVKRKLSSSSLSHLFEQGFVSADLLFRSQEYRIEALAKIREAVGGTTTTVTSAPSYTTPFSIFGPEEITPRDFEVSYAIIAKWNGKSFVEALPFFSKVTLRKHVQDLRLMGYKVSVARINTP